MPPRRAALQAHPTPHLLRDAPDGRRLLVAPGAAPRLPRRGRLRGPPRGRLNRTGHHPREAPPHGLGLWQPPHDRVAGVAPRAAGHGGACRGAGVPLRVCWGAPLGAGRQGATPSRRGAGRSQGRRLLGSWRCTSGPASVKSSTRALARRRPEGAPGGGGGLGGPISAQTLAPFTAVLRSFVCCVYLLHSCGRLGA